ncbi:MAG TPA: hypothetical protein VIP77_21465, partial [Jiangellaceae bacterium]
GIDAWYLTAVDFRTGEDLLARRSCELIWHEARPAWPAAPRTDSWWAHDAPETIWVGWRVFFLLTPAPATRSFGPVPGVVLKPPRRSVSQ